MEREFTHLNHWQNIIPPEDVASSDNELTAFVSNYFKKYHFQLKEQYDKSESNLIFALIEVVTASIDDLSGIGRTYHFTSDPGLEAKKVSDGYKQHLLDMKSKGEKYITEYPDWYSNDAFILMISGDGSLTNPVSRDHVYRWYREPEKASDEILVSEFGGSSENDIIQALNKYANEVIPILKLDKYSNSFIIVKPVSLLDDLRRRRPIGNFFFHISVREKITEAQIVNFLNSFILVWLRNYWSTIFNVLATDIKKRSFEFNENFYKYNTLNKISTARKFHNGFSINDIFITFFKEDEINGGTFRKSIYDEVFPIIVKGLFALKIKDGNPNVSEFIRYAYSTNVKSFENKDQDQIKELLKQFIVVHLIIKAGILVFDLHIEQLSLLIRDPSKFEISYLKYNEEFDNASERTMKDYFQRERLIYLGTGTPKNKEKIKKSIISSMSHFEVKTFEKGKDTLHLMIDEIINKHTADKYQPNKSYIYKPAIESLQTCIDSGTVGDLVDKLRSCIYNIEKVISDKKLA